MILGSLGKTKTDQNDRTTDMFMIQHMTKSVILGSVIIFALIIIIICLVVRIKKIERGNFITYCSFSSFFFTYERYL